VLGCHVATLRNRIRRGQLSAVRGPHGAYYVPVEELARLGPVRRGRPRQPRSLPAHAEQRALSRIEEMLAAKLFRHDVRLAEQMLADKGLYPPAYRLFSVHQLRAAGLATTEVARRLGISERHVRRLARREPTKVFEEVLAKRFRASLEQRASNEARRLVGLIRTRLEREESALTWRSATVAAVG
jgi:ribosomal protein L13E